MKKLCVFCGSSNGKNESYVNMAKSLGKSLALNQIELIYGGATIGVMGAIADSCLEENGKVRGVIPKCLLDYEIVHQNLTELFVVESMHERKKLMYDLADGFLIIPGGMGTLDEMFEILTWAQLGIHNKPCYLFNFNGFFDSLLDFLKKSHEEGFIKREHFNLLHVFNSNQEKELVFEIQKHFANRV